MKAREPQRLQTAIALGVRTMAAVGATAAEALAVSAWFRSALLVLPSRAF